MRATAASFLALGICGGLFSQRAAADARATGERPSSRRELAMEPRGGSACCRHLPAGEILDDARKRLGRAEGELALARKAYGECADSVVRDQKQCIAAGAGLDFAQCLIEQRQKAARYCAGWQRRKDRCENRSDPTARRSCLEALHREYRVETLQECVEKYAEYHFASGRAFPGNPCTAGLEKACPPVVVGCAVPLRELNGSLARSSDLAYELRRLESVLAGHETICARTFSMQVTNSRDCGEANVVAHYDCYQDGGMACLFRECAPPREESLRVCIGGKQLSSSGLKGGPSDYHTEYQVEYTADVGGARISWTEQVRVEGSRSWHGYSYFECFDVPLGRYCLAKDKGALLRSLVHSRR